jgi:tetratricopeptide (TPR) repeat protein
MDGEFENAVAEFQAITKEQPDDANAWDSLGEGFLASGLPDKALEAYSRALALSPTFASSIRGRGLALAALGRYDEAFEKPSPDFTTQAFLLSRVGRYRETAEILDQGRREAMEEDDDEATARALLTSASILIEQKQYARALEDLRAAETALGLPAAEAKHPYLVLADLLAGIAEIRAGNLMNAVSRHGAQKSRYDGSERIEANWVAALEGEIALAHYEYARAVSSFKAAQTPVWVTLGGDSLTLFAMNPSSRDGLARVAISRGNHPTAIQEYRRLTAVGAGPRSSAALEPRHVLALARLLDEQKDIAGARAEYERFLKLWANADGNLPEVEEARGAVARLSPPASP